MSVLIIELEQLRTGSIRVTGQVKPAELDLNEQAGFRLGDQVQVDLRLSTTDQLTYYASGRTAYQAAGECRRCLEPVCRERELEVRGVFAYPEALGRLEMGEEERESEGIFPLDPGQKRIDLTDLVREGIVLDYPRYLLCTERCRGLCPICGTNLNQAECNCREASVDPRWSKLKDLEKES